MRAPALRPMDLSFPGTRRLKALAFFSLIRPVSAIASGQTAPPSPSSRCSIVQHTHRCRVAGASTTGVDDLCLASAVLEGDPL
jgi:hypothetical protein